MSHVSESPRRGGVRSGLPSGKLHPIAERESKPFLPLSAFRGAEDGGEPTPSTISSTFWRAVSASPLNLWRESDDDDTGSATASLIYKFESQRSVTLSEHSDYKHSKWGEEDFSEFLLESDDIDLSLFEVSGIFFILRHVKTAIGDRLRALQNLPGLTSFVAGVRAWTGRLSDGTGRVVRRWIDGLSAMPSAVPRVAFQWCIRAKTTPVWLKTVQLLGAVPAVRQLLSRKPLALLLPLHGIPQYYVRLSNPAEKGPALVGILDSLGAESVAVCVESERRAAQVVAALQAAGEKVAPLGKARTGDSLSQFGPAGVRAIVVADTASREAVAGLDASVVVHYDPPKTPSVYHRRLGSSSIMLCLATATEVRHVRAVEHFYVTQVEPLHDDGGGSRARRRL